MNNASIIARVELPSQYFVLESRCFTPLCCSLNLHVSKYIIESSNEKMKNHITYFKIFPKYSRRECIINIHIKLTLKFEVGQRLYFIEISISI